jgi:hypothetical protein
VHRIILLFIWIVLASGVIAQNPEGVSGEWLITRDAYGNPLYQRMTLTFQNGKVTGVFASDKLERHIDRERAPLLAPI